jgi:hemoglobin-like flavoprotein
MCEHTTELRPVADAAIITRSFEIAAERVGDIAPLVYEKLFARYPETEALFSSNKSARGEMVARVIDIVFDFLGPGSYSSAMIQCEVVTHDSYGVPHEIFATFFGMVADTLKDIAGADWSPQMDASWRDLLARLDWFVANPDQMAPGTN